MSLIEHAKRELELLDWTDDKKIYKGLLSEAVLELIEVFSNQGHTGASASVVLPVFMKLARWENLTPITSNPDEWMHIADKKLSPTQSRPLYQSLRNPNFFSHDNLQTYYSVDEPKKILKFK